MGFLKISLSTVIVIQFLGIVSCQNYDDPCSLSIPESCNATQFLSCHQINVAQFRCRCDPEQALESVITPKTCKPFPTQIGQLCDEFPDNLQGFCSKKINGSLCNGSVCVCDTENYFFIPGANCVKYAETLGEDCFYVQQCIKIPGDGAYCDFELTQKCYCPSSTHVPDDIRGCYPRKHQLNETCVIPGQCETINNGVTCHPLQNICHCDLWRDYFLHPNGQECMTFLTALGDSCVPFSRQCERITSGSICNSTTATCGCDDRDYVTDSMNTTCLEYQKTLGGSCVINTTPDHCQIRKGESHCDPSTLACICNEGYDPGNDSNSCFQLSEYVNDLCENDGNCRTVPESLCNEDTLRCTCKELFIPSEDWRSCVFDGPCEEPCLYSLMIKE